MKIIFATFLLFVIVSCSNSDGPIVTKLAINIPKHIDSSSSSKSITRNQLTHIVVNVSGNGIPGRVFWEWDGCNNHDCSNPTAPPSEVILTVPSGPTRLVQVLGVAGKVSEGTERDDMNIYYGDVSKDLVSSNERIDVNISHLVSSSGGEGDLAGRYLTGANSGPTGSVGVYLKPPGKPDIKMMESEIYNGWFSFFVLEGLSFSYVYQGGEGTFTILENVNLNSPVLVASEKMMHIYVPAYTTVVGHNDENNTFKMNNYTHSSEKLLVGFFGPYSNTKKVCYSAVDEVIRNNKTYQGTTLSSLSGFYQSANTDPAALVPLQWRGVTYDAGHVSRISGGISSADPGCQDATKNYIDYVTFKYQNFSDNSNTPFGFWGPFKIVTASSSSEFPGFLKVVAENPSNGNLASYTNAALSFSLLDGVTGSGKIQGVDIYMRTFSSTTPYSSSEYLRGEYGYICSMLSANGFQKLVSLPVSTTSHTIENIAYTDSSKILVVACPFFEADRYIMSTVETGLYNLHPNRENIPSKVSVTGNSTAIVNECTQYSAVLLNQYNSPTAGTGAYTVTLSQSGSGTGTFYTDSSCSSSMSSTTIAASSSSTDFYFKYNTVESINITASVSGLEAGSLTVAFSSASLSTYCRDYASATTYNQMGSGTSASPYLICTSTQLLDLTAKCSSSQSEACDDYYKLMTDLDMTGITTFTPIGNSTNKFTGSFDGNEKTISNLTIGFTNPTQDVGFFGYTSSTALIDDITLASINFSASMASTTYPVGGLVGTAEGGTIQECSTSGAMSISGPSVPTSLYVGGLIGKATSTTISQNNSSVNVSGGGLNYMGGLIGYASAATITWSYASGNMEANTSTCNAVGGLIGELVATSTIENSYATGTISISTAGTYAGGLVGIAYLATITSCRATGAMTENSASVYMGGLVGFLSSSTLTASYATGAITATNTGVYAGGLVAKSTTSIIVKSYSSTGAIGSSGGSSYTGGLVAFNDGASGSTKIEDCYSTREVAGMAYVGGLVGLNSGANALINRCYASGNVSATATQGGGLVGSVASSAKVEYSFSTGDVSSPDYGGVFYGSLGGTSTDNYFSSGVSLSCGTNCTTSGTNVTSKALTDFYLSSNPPYTLGPWDFSAIWQTNSGALPTLK